MDVIGIDTLKSDCCFPNASRLKGGRPLWKQWADSRLAVFRRRASPLARFLRPTNAPCSCRLSRSLLAASPQVVLSSTAAYEEDKVKPM